MIAACEAQLRESGVQPDTFFFTQRNSPSSLLDGYEQVGVSHEYWTDAAPQALVLDEVEAIWAAIDRDDDWAPFHAKIAAIRRMGEAHGTPPAPAGHGPNP
jgi:hypothetical protein